MTLTGKRVERAVYVMGKRVPMGEGIVVRDDGGGTCQVDIMSLHGGAPWLVYEATAHLRVVTPRESAP